MYANFHTDALRRADNTADLCSGTLRLHPTTAIRRRSRRRISRCRCRGASCFRGLSRRTLSARLGDGRLSRRLYTDGGTQCSTRQGMAQAYFRFSRRFGLPYGGLSLVFRSQRSWNFALVYRRFPAVSAQGFCLCGSRLPYFCKIIFVTVFGCKGALRRPARWQGRCRTPSAG